MKWRVELIMSDECIEHIDPSQCEESDWCGYAFDPQAISNENEARNTAEVLLCYGTKHSGDFWQEMKVVEVKTDEDSVT